MAKRIKVHPMDYIAPKSKNRKDHRGESLHHIQIVHMRNGQIRVIKHYMQHLIGGGASY